MKILMQFPTKPCFLSTPVLMHGGLLRVAFCLSGCHYTKIHQKKNHISKTIWSVGTRCSLLTHRNTSLRLKICHPTSRWAHNNVKLHFFPFRMEDRVGVYARMGVQVVLRQKNQNTSINFNTIFRKTWFFHLEWKRGLGGLSYP